MDTRITLPFGDTEYEVRPGKIIALGLNYHSHLQESTTIQVQGFTTEVPAEPLLFPKLPTSIIGPGDAIVLPAILDRYRFDDERTDYEGELAILIGRGGRNIPVERAMESVSGFTCANDVSQRNIQNADRSGWFRGKSFDTFLPLGPVVVSPQKLGDPHALKIETRLNGKTVQSSNTGQMIFGVPEIVSFISRNFRLEEGDIILTGTPSGIGALHEGDTVEVEIEGIGILSNRVEREAG